MNPSFPLALAFAATLGLARPAGAAAPSPGTAAPRPNVLLITVDDLNDWAGPTGGHPQARTPALDRLAAQGTVFTNAHCQAPICHPSRVSFMTGMLPSTTGMYSMGPMDFRRDCPALRDAAATPTLPEHFAAHGYRTLGVGKIFHNSSATDTFQEYGPRGDWGPFPADGRKLVDVPGGSLWDWGRFPARDEDTVDRAVADWAAERLAEPAERPFFLAVGFFRPHAPMYAPASWWESQPDVAGIRLPPHRADDRADLGAYAQALTYAATSPRHSFFETGDRWREAVQAYLACLSFVDAQIGRLLAALDRSPHARHTIVVLLGDNGLSLGEKSRWGKRSLWERDTRVPLLVRAPGLPAGGRCAEPAGLVDLFPTLVELCGLAPPPRLEGSSLVPQLRDPAAVRAPTLTSFFAGNHAVRSRDHRYIRYADGSEELYDHRTDPHEWHNLAGRADQREVVRELARSLPRVNTPALPGSTGLGVDPARRDWFGGVP
ncbi:MAG: sulfatase [Opitutaceae bacterium]